MQQNYLDHQNLDHQDIAQEILDANIGLSLKEASFLENILEQTRLLTPKQKSWLDSLQQRHELESEILRQIRKDKD